MDRIVLSVTDKAFLTILNLVFFFLRLPLGAVDFTAFGFSRAGGADLRSVGLGLGRGELLAVDVRRPALEVTACLFGAAEETTLFFFAILEDGLVTELTGLFEGAVRFGTLRFPAGFVDFLL